MKRTVLARTSPVPTASFLLWYLEGFSIRTALMFSFLCMILTPGPRWGQQAESHSRGDMCRYDVRWVRKNKFNAPCGLMHFVSALWLGHPHRGQHSSMISVRACAPHAFPIAAMVFESGIQLP